MKNKLYVMVGVPGSGKSTYAKQHYPNAIYVSRDEIRFELVKENEEYFSKEDEVFRKFIYLIDFNLKAGRDVIADATHLNPNSRAKLFSHLDINKEKTEVIAVVMRTPLNICLDRNENRRGTRSYVPRTVIKRMFYSFKIPTTQEYNSIIDTVYIVAVKKGEDKNGLFYE